MLLIDAYYLMRGRSLWDVWDESIELLLAWPRRTRSADTPHGPRRRCDVRSLSESTLAAAPSCIWLA
jgi:hypothetical protein